MSDDIIAQEEKNGFVVTAIQGGGVIVVNNNPEPNPHAINSIQKLNDGTVVAYDRSGEQVIPAPTQIENNGVVVTVLPEKGQGIFIMNNNDGTSLQVNEDGKVHKHSSKDFEMLLEGFTPPNLDPNERQHQPSTQQPQATRSSGGRSA